MPRKKTPQKDNFELEFDEASQSDQTKPLSDDDIFALKTDSGHVDEMFSDWFLDYASYVILERACPMLMTALSPFNAESSTLCVS